jgi:hypothetical protein
LKYLFKRCGGRRHDSRSLILLLDQLRFETAPGEGPTPATTQTKTVIAAYEMRCIFAGRVRQLA